MGLEVGVPFNNSFKFNFFINKPMVFLCVFTQLLLPPYVQASSPQTCFAGWQAQTLTCTVTSIFVVSKASENCAGVSCSSNDEGSCCMQKNCGNAGNTHAMSSSDADIPVVCDAGTIFKTSGSDTNLKDVTCTTDCQS